MPLCLQRGSLEILYDGVFMEPRKITEGVFWAGAVDWDRRLFDALIPLPDGTSYNAYIVEGRDKTALLDTVEPSMTSVLLEELKGIRKVDYIVSHHAEQDHSGSIPAVLERFPGAKVVTSPKGKELLMLHLHLPEEVFITVADKETIDLGGKTLEVIYTPWVHWPETMCTYLKEDGILFSCDLFGSHLAFTGLSIDDEQRVCEASKRYFAEVMMPFRPTIKKHLDRFDNYSIKTIAPSHGPIYIDPRCIISSHKEWVSDNVKNRAVIAYATMHGSTEILVEALSAGLWKRGVEVERFNLATADTGRLAMALVDSATIVLGSPTILGGAHPLVISAAFLVNALRPKLRFAAIIGSQGWAGKMVEQITAHIGNLKAEVMPPVIAKGKPTGDDLKEIDALAALIAEKHKTIGILQGHL